MHGRFLSFLAPFYIVVLAVSGHAASPDDPAAAVPANRYSPITLGTKSYRPVEPLPWGDVIRRVMPKAKPREEEPVGQEKQGSPPEPKLEH
jgi:hypothetical protein